MLWHSYVNGFICSFLFFQGAWADQLAFSVVAMVIAGRPRAVPGAEDFVNFIFSFLKDFQNVRFQLLQDLGDGRPKAKIFKDLWHWEKCYYSRSNRASG